MFPPSMWSSRAKPVRVSDEAKLHLVADAYASKYEWPLTVRDGAFFEEYGAPSAGSPPYDPYEILERAGEAAHGEHTCSDRSNSHTSPHRSDASGWMDVGWRSDEAKES